ncbi:bacterial surface protein [Paenibacillus thiaminolyticus]|uniref:Bacterial surface protein n=2 Tax=Paenibacillus thiaminolyticus TaxID=49283 RepID=A0A3A3GH58_PANTH|nr:bacterial surface protein [Paenibacillus thiaminolyticus]
MHGDKLLPTKYYDLQGIKKAEGWADPNRFGQFYDIKVTYSANFTAWAQIKLSDGTEVSITKIPNKAIAHGNWPVGSSIFHTFDNEITDDKGKKYRIYKSYIRAARKPGEQKFQQDGDPDTNPKLTNRNFTIALGGTYVVGVYKEINSPPPPDPDPTPGTKKCTLPAPLQTIPDEVMDPKASALIKADSRGNERFDVSLGIPTSETLYANSFALNYLFKNKFVQMGGTCTYEVPVEKTFTKKWTEPAVGEDGKPSKEEFEEEETVSDVITVERPYSYWVIDNLEVYKIRETKLQNTALPSGGVTLSPSGYTPPDYTVSQQGGIVSEPAAQQVTLPPQTVGKDLPNYSGEFKAAAEKAIGKVQVRNDSLTFKGKSIMDGDPVEESGLTPGKIPQPYQINENVLYKDRLLIESHKVNAKDIPSTGTIYYDLLPQNINGGANKQYPIYGINTVTIHTPVVIYAKVSDDRDHNQKTNPNPNRSAFILDRPFSIQMPTYGQHRDIKGYGNRDYAKYYRSKEVRFPFDTYSADKRTFHPKGTWINIPVSQESTSFFLPVWVDEGDYTVDFRVTAENAPSGVTDQHHANLNLQHHRATDTALVEVIGRVYDFRITDIMDFKWEDVFRKKKGSKEHSGLFYWVGQLGIDGEVRGNKSPYVLPIRRGSHPNPGYKNVAVKTGYSFKFDLKSKGNMFGPDDAIRITPTFYYVDKNGENRQEVDIYYHTDKRKFVKIGSQYDTVQRKVKLDERLRNMDQQTMVNTAAAYYNLHPNQMEKNQQTFINDWLKRAKKDTIVGGYSHILLPKELRTYMGPLAIPEGVNPSRAYAAIQQWYAEYNLPSKVYVVPKGFDLSKQFNFNDNAPFFLRNGYIIVNFNIETIRNGNQSAPHLQYIYAPLTNQWKREGFSYSAIDPYGIKFQLKDGDVMFYHADKSSVDDFTVGGTH